MSCRRFSHIDAEAVERLARTRRALAPAVILDPDPLSPADRAALAEEARAAGKPQRAQLIGLGMLTPRQAYGELAESEDTAAPEAAS